MTLQLRGKRLIAVLAGIVIVIVLIGLYFRGPVVSEARAVSTGKAIGVYVTVTNKGLRSLCLVDVRLGEDVTGVMADIHKTVEEGGVYRMEPVDKICIKPLGKLEMRHGPGSYHIMIMGKNVDKIAEDGIATVYLVFDDGSEIRIDAPISG